ncbi:segregation/condensation protein A [Dermacoccus nishinomiyaensis]|uniref:segregation and condensation protein A n=1 Tax=Dermacoccus TaxID=57495 RepID=UPI0010AD8908|nr:MULTISPECIES: ScpA family protein [Dermacoccus]TJZ97612.1 segregation/condensation protein A [Dermacoccus nishinomiyaensis]
MTATEAEPVGDAPASAVAVTTSGPTAASTASAPGGVLTRRAAATPFHVHLGEVFDGPFDLLLGLIAKHRLDVTQISLSQVTDEFIAHIRAAREASDEWDLSQATEFLLIAATLLDIKAARLLPNLGGSDEEDFELIEARDLLFARLLQYRAFKDMAQFLADRMESDGRLVARQAGLEERFSGLLPELVMTVTPEQLAAIAARALTPKTPPSVDVDHLHAVQVSVREQARIVTSKLRRGGELTFAQLVADAEHNLVVVGRFLAILELFKEAAIAFEQAEHLRPLTVRWVAAPDARILVSDEYDAEPGSGGEGASDDAAS